MTRGADRWSQNWQAIAPPGAVRVELPRWAPKRAQGVWLSTLMPGTPVVLSASAPGAIRRCSSFAARTGIEVEREYLAFPSAAAPAYLVEDAPASTRHFFGTVLAPPPEPALALPLALSLSLLRRLASWTGLRRIAPGRLVIGRLT